MSWFSRLFSRREPEAAPVRAPFAIPLPEGYDPKRLERPRPPKRNLKKFTAEEIAADDNRYKKEMRAKFMQNSRFDRDRAQRIGCKIFIWRSCGDAATCTACVKNDGKRFCYAEPPAFGFPGEHDCPIGWCRCFAEPVIKGLP